MQHTMRRRRAAKFTVKFTRGMFQVQGEPPLRSTLWKQAGGLPEITNSLHREQGADKLRAESVLWCCLSVHNGRGVLARLELVTLF